jgi:hypothetical protein
MSPLSFSARPSEGGKPIPFDRIHKTLGVTPAIAADPADKHHEH